MNLKSRVIEAEKTLSVRNQVIDCQCPEVELTDENFDQRAPALFCGWCPDCHQSIIPRGMSYGDWRISLEEAD